jgi:hypothetical protein
MARCATSGSVEVLFSGLGVAGLEIGDIDPPATTWVRLSVVSPVMDKGHQIGDVMIGEIETRHAHVWAPVPNDVPDFIPANIFSDQLRGGEVGPSLSATGITSVTEAAVLEEERLTRLNRALRLAVSEGNAGQQDA